MAVTETLLSQGNDFQQWDVIASADADTVTATVTHRMGPNPSVSVTALTLAGRLSGWVLTTINNTQWLMTKSTAVGSGAAPAQARVRIDRNN